MFLMYLLGCLVTYVSLVILMKDSLVGRDTSEVVDLYITVFCLSVMFPITLTLALAHTSALNEFLDS